MACLFGKEAFELYSFKILLGYLRLKEVLASLCANFECSKGQPEDKNQEILQRELTLSTSICETADRAFPTVMEGELTVQNFHFYLAFTFLLLPPPSINDFSSLISATSEHFPNSFNPTQFFLTKICNFLKNFRSLQILTTRTEKWCS